MFGIFKQYLFMLLASLGNTLLLALFALVFAMLIGLFFALLNVSRNRVLNAIGTIYVDCLGLFHLLWRSAGNQSFCGRL